jgi:hypothetical protein
MAQIFGTLALILATSATIGPPDDAVGIGDDASVDTDAEPGPRQVSIDLERWNALRAIAEFEQPVVKPPGPWAADRQVQIERATDGVRIRVTWTLEALEGGWFAGPLIGPVTGMRVESLTWLGRELGVTSTSAGEEVALEMKAKSRGALKLVVFVPADQLPGGVDGSIGVWLLPAVHGELRVDGKSPEGQVPELVADGQARRMIDGRFWAGEAQLSLSWVDATTASDDAQGPLAVAQSSVGLTFGDGEVRGRARVSWLLRRGQLDRVSIDTAGLGIDLEVVGPNVHEWARSGDRIDIVLKEPVDGRIDVDLRWTQGLPQGAEAQLAAPRITPQQAYRTESFMQIARDGELEVVPELSGWSAVASTELPEWAGGYIQGTATATYRHDGESSGARFDLLRFVPLSGPPVMVDVAAYEVATTEEGRSLVLARYDVRNERASHLRLELPNGSRMLGVRVNGETVTPTRDATSADTEVWRIPLVRSLESVKGSLSFPVEVIFIGEADGWKKKEARELQLPALDAPVAVSRVQVYLPPNYENRVDVGDFHRVDDFSEGGGITYGLGVGAGSAEVGRADELYREAVSSWMDNDFRRAQSSLDELAQLGASNMNIEGLQANLDLVHGSDDKDSKEGKNDEAAGSGGQSAVVERRIKDQANMRATEDRIALHEREREADELEAQGEYDKAEEKLAEAQEIGDRLARLEQTESQEQIVYNQSLSSKSARVADKKKRKVSRESAAKQSKGKITVYDFEDDGVEGELLAPEGANIQSRARDGDGIMDIVDSPIAGPIGGEIAAPPPTTPEPMPDPMPPPMKEPEEPIAIDMEETKSITMSTSTTRDFTAVVEEEENALADSAPDRSHGPREGRGRQRWGAKGGRKDTSRAPQGASPEKPAEPEPEPMPTTPAQDPNAALAGPVATASAVTVHVPAVGEAVLYQHMLLPEGKALTVHLEARRHKPSKRKSK